MDETSGASLGLGIGVPCYQIDDEEGRTHLLIQLTLKEEDADRWCFWRPRSPSARDGQKDGKQPNYYGARRPGGLVEERGTRMSTTSHFWKQVGRKLNTAVLGQRALETRLIVTLCVTLRLSGPPL
jgi:hypothetical protein